MESPLARNTKVQFKDATPSHQTKKKVKKTSSQPHQQSTARSEKKLLAEKESELEALRAKIQKKWKLGLTTNAKDEFTLFQFFALGTSPSINDQFVEQGNFVFLRNVHSRQWVDVMNLLHTPSPAAAG